MKTARTYEELKARLDEMSGRTAEKQADKTAEAKKKANKPACGAKGNEQGDGCKRVEKRSPKGDNIQQAAHSRGSGEN